MGNEGLEELLCLLSGRDYLITSEHYGNSNHGPLKKIYVVGHVFDHTAYNRHGYDIIVVSEEMIDELRMKK